MSAAALNCCPTVSRATAAPRLAWAPQAAPCIFEARKADRQLRRRDLQRFATRAAAQTQETAEAVRPTEWLQKVIELPPFSRGCHVITRDIVQQLPELAEFEVGMANFFVQHTSASLTINENASPDVPLDLADSLDRLAPEGNKMQYRHDDEGPDENYGGPRRLVITVQGQKRADGRKYSNYR